MDTARLPTSPVATPTGLGLLAARVVVGPDEVPDPVEARAPRA